MTDEYGFVFNKNLCIQCNGCEGACAVYRDVPTGHFRRVKTVWQGRFPDVSRAARMLSCCHCLEPACIPVCPVTAIAKQPGGIVTVDADICIGCEACSDACPVDAPRFNAAGKMEKCDMCLGRVDFGADRPPCVATCPTGALSWKKMTVEEKRSGEAAFR